MPESSNPRPETDSGVDYGQTMNVGRAHAAVAREKDSSVVAHSPVPLSLWALLPIGGAFLAGGAYLGSNAGIAPNANGYHAAPQLPAGLVIESGGDTGSPYEPAKWLALGKANYNNICQTCHKPGGEGQPGQYPPLKDSEFVIHGDKRTVAIVLHGINGPLTVNGQTYNSEMPAQGAKLTNSEIAQIVSYIRHDWDNNASMVYDDQVAALRKEMGSAGFLSESTLRAIPEDAMLPPSTRPAELAAEQAADAAPPDAAAPDGAAAPAPANAQ